MFIQFCWNVRTQIVVQLSDVLRQGGVSPSPSSGSSNSDQRTPRTRFGLRMGFKTKAARNISLMLVRYPLNIGSELMHRYHRYWQ
jgi:hypothetical protein